MLLTTIDMIRAARRVHRVDIGGGNELAIREPTLAQLRGLGDSPDASGALAALAAELIEDGAGGRVFATDADAAESLGDSAYRAFARWLGGLGDAASAEKNSGPPPAADAGGCSS
jgi:hypothetical protein